MREKSPLWVLLLLLFSLLPTTLAAMVCYDIVSPMHPEVLTPVDCWPTATHNSLIKRVTNKGISLHEYHGRVSHTQHLHQLDPRARAPSDHAWVPRSGPGSGPGPGPHTLGPTSGAFRPALRPAPSHASGPDSPLAPDPVPPPAPSPASGPASSRVDSRPPPPPHSTGKTPPPFPGSPSSLLTGSSSELESPSGYNSGNESDYESDSDSDSDSDDEGGGRNDVHNSSHNEPNLPFFNFAPTSPLSEILSAPASPVPDWNSDQRIFFNLQCEQSSITCDGMSQTLNLAGWYVSQIIHFHASLQVNVSLTDFCEKYGKCNSSSGDDVILGGSVPARTFPLVDDDDTVRYYPQAVVRQMDFPSGETPQFSTSDILIEFNSKANFYFENPKTGTSIQSNEYDFLTIAIHELMHGLGFISSWADYLEPNNPKILTPQIALSSSSQNGVQFEGFVEYEYDRLMSLRNYPGVFATNLSAEMITAFGHLGNNFTDATALGNAFLSSPAAKFGGYMDGNATERDAIQQNLPVTSPSSATLQNSTTPGPLITLETSFRPFASGSSLNHVDSVLYTSTQDFLMRYSTPMGKTLQQFIDDYGTTGDTTYGPFGPGLRYILAGIGYRVRGGIPLGGSPLSLANGTVGTSSTNSSNSSKPSAGNRRESSWTLRINVYWLILWSCVLFH